MHFLSGRSQLNCPANNHSIAAPALGNKARTQSLWQLVNCLFSSRFTAAAGDRGSDTIYLWPAFKNGFWRFEAHPSKHRIISTRSIRFRSQWDAPRPSIHYPSPEMTQRHSQPPSPKQTQKTKQHFFECIFVLFFITSLLRRPPPPTGTCQCQHLMGLLVRD